MDVSVSYVWVPNQPRFIEERALAEVAERFADQRVVHYWDDTKVVGREVRKRLTGGDLDGVPEDVFVLFDGGAAWRSAGEHVVGWGGPVGSAAQELLALLDDLVSQRRQAESPASLAE